MPHRSQLVLLAALGVIVASCASDAPRRQPPPPPPPPAAPAPTATVDETVVTGNDTVENARVLWLRLRANAEKAIQQPAGDTNAGWLERAIESDGRALFTLLSRQDFDRFAVQRDAARARLLIVIKPPTVEDRREAVQAVDAGIGEIVKRAR